MCLGPLTDRQGHDLSIRNVVPVVRANSSGLKVSRLAGTLYILLVKQPCLNGVSGLKLNHTYSNEVTEGVSMLVSCSVQFWWKYRNVHVAERSQEDVQSSTPDT